MPPGLLLLAAFIGGAFAALLITRVLHVRGPSVVRWGSTRSSARLQRSAHQPSPAEVEAWQLAYSLHRSIERSALSRVIGVGTSQTTDGTTVEFIAVELRAAGGRGSLRIHSTHEFTAHANAHVRPAEPAPPTVTDESGTHYVAGWGARNGSGDDDYTEVTAEFLFAPDPPPGARVLTVTIPRSIAFASGVESQEDPWVVAAPLHPRAV